jgi:hypothetical protein
MQKSMVPVELQGIRLEICNPDHIAAVRQYELDHGYDRDAGTTQKRFKISLSASIISSRSETKNVYVYASSERIAEKKALQLCESLEWDIFNDETVGDIDFDIEEANEK